MNDMKLEKRFRENQKKFREHLKQIKKDLYPKPEIDIKPLVETIKYIETIEKAENKVGLCHICFKQLKNEHGVKIHIGKVHKTNKQTNKLTKTEKALVEIGKDNNMLNNKQIKFNNDGNYLKGTITRNYPQNKKPKPEKRTFYCTKHRTYHKYIYHGKPSKTYQKCLNSELDFYEFRENMDNYEQSRIDFKRRWKRESRKQEKAKNEI